MHDIQIVRDNLQRFTVSIKGIGWVFPAPRDIAKHDIFAEPVETEGQYGDEKKPRGKKGAFSSSTPLVDLSISSQLGVQIKLTRKTL